MALHTTNPGDTKRQMNLAPFSMWSSTQTYAADDLVVSSSGVWKARVSSRAQSPDENVFWTRVVGGGGSLNACIAVGSTTDNSLEICGSTAGSPVTLTAIGIDPAIAIQLTTKVGIARNPNIIISQAPGETIHEPWVSGGGLTMVDNDAFGGAISAIQAGSATGSGGTLNLMRSRGTVDAPTTVQNGDYLATIAIGGFGSTQTDFGAFINGRVDAAPVGNNVPTGFEFWTGTGSGSQVNLQITSTGGIITPRVYTSNPNILGALYVTTTARLLAVSSG